ncbi:hypothetical protein SAMN04488063_0058 [Halopelagius inordinatus]|uniref:DUF3784 domain-containing protein n=1 Tax=Halopelagius inordinatus TaxID=553467 RepID=A0A1I2X0B6_9EURY|nr:hypothetical protein [Halopelagius inordinatus]SFH06319.1 hypothetical protein SAMN04488063_0058 [Halopelagius inordinatus]
MMELPSEALEWLAVGCLLTVAGALIKFRGWTFLLAGYDETAPVPESVVRNVTGNTLLRVGIAVFVVGIVESVTNPPSYLGVVVGVAIALEVARLLYRLNARSPQAT